MLNVVQYLKFHCQKVESTRNGKLRRLSGRFQTLIWRPGETVQNFESPGLSGRVDMHVYSPGKEKKILESKPSELAIVN